MDSAEFEEYFDIETSNKIIGMQLLTSDVMELLVDYTIKNNMKYEIVIRDSIIYLRFHCGNIFEPKKIYKDVLEKSSLENYFNILNFTYDLSNKLIKIIQETEV